MKKPATDYLDLVRTIRDPLYGSIHLTEEELLIVDHALFRRLHNIRQNGLLYYVFPSATHTRFEHSLGVLHSASSIFQSLFHNSFVSLKKPTSAVKSEKKSGMAFNINELDDQQLTEAFRILRIAALVHDLGHGPLSHTFDSFAPQRESIVQLIEKEKVLEPLKPIIDTLKKSKNPRVEHEEMSCVLFTIIWNEISDESIIPLLISSVLLNFTHHSFSDEQKEVLSLLKDIISSAPADADRMDYIERDSRSFGVSYGIYDRERLLKSYLVYCEKNGAAFQYRLGIKKSGIRAVENFVQARFELFAQVYYHKTNQAIEQMLKEIAEIADNNKVDIFDSEELTRIRDRYLNLTDKKFVDILTTEVDNEDINSLAKDISDRKLWKRVFGDHYDGKETLEMLKHLEKEKSYPLKYVPIDPKATKDLDTGAKVLKRDKAGIYSVFEERDWLALSPMIKALNKRENDIHRIYLKSSNKDKAKELRTLIRQKETEIISN